MPLPHHVPHHSEKSLVSLSFCRCPKSSISKLRHLHLPSASQLFPVIGSASIFRVQQPTSFTRHLCLCHRSLDTLTVTLMWGVSQHLSDHLHPIMAQSHFYHHPTPSFLFIISLFLISASS